MAHIYGENKGWEKKYIKKNRTFSSRETHNQLVWCQLIGFLIRATRIKFGKNKQVVSHFTETCIKWKSWKQFVTFKGCCHHLYVALAYIYIYSCNWSDKVRIESFSLICVCVYILSWHYKIPRKSISGIWHQVNLVCEKACRYEIIYILGEVQQMTGWFKGPCATPDGLQGLSENNICVLQTRDICPQKWSKNPTFISHQTE